MSGSSRRSRRALGIENNAPQPPTDTGLSNECEILVSNSHVDDRGFRKRIPIKQASRLVSPVTHNKALELVRFFPPKHKYETATLEIRSPHLCGLLRKLIDRVPGVFLNDTIIKIAEPPYCLFHCMSSLEQIKDDASTDSTARKHVELLLQYVALRFHENIKAYNEHKLQPHGNAALEYENLWMIFPPGSYVYYSSADGNKVASKVDQIYRHTGSATSAAEDEWTLTLLNVDRAGCKYHWRRTSHRLKRYDGYKQISQLEVCPLKYCSEGENIVQRLEKRGERFMSLQDIAQMSYDGMAYELCSQDPTSVARRISGHVIIDTTNPVDLLTATGRPSSEARHDSGHIRPAEPELKIDVGTDGELVLDAQDLTTCWPTVTAYDLTSKRWHRIDVKDITDIKVDEMTYENLFIPHHLKDRLREVALCTQRNGLDGKIKRHKIKNCTVLLHGPSGSGKTYAIESLASTLERPLVTIYLGDFGLEPSVFRQGLVDTLQQAQAWGAIVAIENTEWYFKGERRNDLCYSALSSILLRCHREYEGLVVLLSCQPLPQSETLQHVALTIPCPLPDAEARRSLWRRMLGSHQSADDPSLLDEDSITKLASHELDAWQITNAVNSAIHVTCDGDVRSAAKALEYLTYTAFEGMDWNSRAQSTAENSDAQLSPLHENKKRRRSGRSS